MPIIKPKSHYVSADAQPLGEKAKPALDAVLSEDIEYVEKTNTITATPGNRIVPITAMLVLLIGITAPIGYYYLQPSSLSDSLTSFFAREPTLGSHGEARIEAEVELYIKHAAIAVLTRREVESAMGDMATLDAMGGENSPTKTALENIHLLKRQSLENTRSRLINQLYQLHTFHQKHPEHVVAVVEQAIAKAET